MVDLPSGKMKSREGTVVDADDLMADMTQTAANISEELGKLEDYNEEECKAEERTLDFHSFVLIPSESRRMSALYIFFYIFFNL